jgi:hypothetical protein
MPAILLPLVLNWRTTLAGGALLTHGVLQKDVGSILGGIGLVVAQDPDWLRALTALGKK